MRTITVLLLPSLRGLIKDLYRWATRRPFYEPVETYWIYNNEYDWAGTQTEIDAAITAGLAELEHQAKRTQP